MRKEIILPFICGASFFVAKAENTKPNIVFILVDDLGWSDVSYGGRSDYYETPELEKMSMQGMTFTNYYTAGPVSSPTRASILTGKYPVRTGITTYLLSPDKDPEHITNELSTDEVTFAEVLRDNSYKTGYFGKWHLGYSKEHWAANQGFEIAIGGMDLPHAWQIAHPDKKTPDLDVSKGHTRFFSPHHLTFMEDGPEGEYLTDRLTNETIKFITDNKDKPFMAFLSFHTVHTPLEPKPDKLAKYKAKAKRMGLTDKDVVKDDIHNNPEYAAMIEHMDENVGRVLRCLEDLGIDDNTLVVFSSDNGGKHGVTSARPLKGAKHSLDEGGIRVHTVVKWPGIVEKNTTCDIPVISTDLYATFVDVAGIDVDRSQCMDGISLKGLLSGKQKELNRDAIYWHYPHSRMEGAMRMGDYKLLHNYKTDKSSLYNLRNDIGEKIDISDNEVEIVKKMERMFKKWLIEVDANFPQGYKEVLSE